MNKSLYIPLGILLSLSIASCSNGNSEDPVATDGSDSTSQGAGSTSGSSSSGSANDDATAGSGSFGLTEREALADLSLPIDGVQLGDYQLVNAYPNIQFLEALLVDDVPGENRLVVVEQFGKIKVFNDDPSVTSTAEILDYSDQISITSGEQGLLGLAFDPRFTENRFVYIYHTQVTTNTSIITRLPWDRGTDRLDRSQAKIIMQIDQPFETHNGGMMAFGADNFLYVSLGDGGDGGDPFNNAQNKSNLLGSIIRIDVNTQDDSVGYVVPASNPYVGQDGVRPEIWAHGFRNPWRFSFDRETGDMWLGDVGQETFEEINKVKAGGNYGWRVYEGTRPNEASGNTLPDSAFTPPIHEYNHDQGLAVIGGYVYRGAVSSLQGRYLFSDFYNGEVKALTLNGETVTSIDVVGTIDGPTSFGETRDGELLVVSRYGGLFKFAENSTTIEFPENLSQTGVFSDLASLTPVSGLIEYQPSHPFWSDGTIKRRWIGVPDDVKIDFTDNDWSFPLGSVSVKHFEIDMVENTPSSRRRLETRILYNTVQGWEGYSYRWNAEQTEAVRLATRESEQLVISMNDGTVSEQQYDYPSRADCTTCHTEASTYLLGLETAQLNAKFDYKDAIDNQLRSLNNIGLFSYDIGAADQYKVLPPLGDETATVEARARAYLDVNCSTCHQPTGSAPTTMDFRAEMSNAELNAIDVWPQAGSFDISDPRIIAPGSKERSVLLHRMNILEGGRMPPISTHVVDEAAVELIGRWIDSLPAPAQ